MKISKMTIGELEAMGAQIKIFFHGSVTEKEAYDKVNKFKEPMKNKNCGDKWFEASKGYTEVIAFYEEEE